MEGFWLAETLKYFWLLFGGNELEMSGPLDLSKTVLNTEAHFLPRFELGKIWNTGWERTNPKFGGKQINPGYAHMGEDETGEDHNAATNGEIIIPKLEDPEGSLDGLGKPPSTPTKPEPQDGDHAGDKVAENLLNLDPSRS